MMSTLQLVNVTRVCNHCGSHNNLAITFESEAWECWNCQDKHWLGEVDRIHYAKKHNIGLLRADIDLDAGFPIFAGASI